MAIYDDLCRKIKEQQGDEFTNVWGVGEQLKDICRNDDTAAELVLRDLDNKEMTLAECEKKIRAFADEHKKGNCVCVPPQKAEEIIRTFYGLGEAKEEPETVSHAADAIDLDAFL